MILTPIALSKIDWQFFCSLTLKKELRNDDWAVKKFFGLMRELAGWNHVHFLKMIWCLRSEDGEITERRHYHALLGGLPEHTIHVGTAMSIKAQWEKLGGGFARVFVFNPTLGGVDYVLQALREVEEGLSGKVGVHSLGASVYEMSKFRPSKLMLSKSLLSVIQKRMEIRDKQFTGKIRRQADVWHTASDSKREGDGQRCETDSGAQAKTRFPSSSTVGSGARKKETVNVASWINILKA